MSEVATGAVAASSANAGAREERKVAATSAERSFD
jgi:hypothetical protein